MKKIIHSLSKVCFHCIKSKLHKSFLDYYLLGQYEILILKYFYYNDNQSQYSIKYTQYNQLNFLEKILLLSILKNKKTTQIQRKARIMTKIIKITIRLQTIFQNIYQMFKNHLKKMQQYLINYLKLV